MKLRFKIDLSDGQKEAYKALHDPKIKYMILNWSRQCGKSTFAEIACIESLCKTNKFSAYIMPTYNHCKKVYAELMKMLDPLNIVKRSNASDLRIESIFGTVLQFFSGEAAQNIRGNTISDILIIDEAAYFSDILPNGEDIWFNVIMPTTKVRCKKIIMISTPAGKRGFFFNFYNRGMNGLHPDYFCMTRTIYDDKLTSAEDIKSLEESTPKKIYDQEFRCIFLDTSLSFFENYDECFKPYDYGYERTWIGVDLAANGTDETIVTKINEKNEVEQIKVSGTLSMKYNQIATIINESVNLQNCYIEVNGVGAPMYAEILKLVKNKSRVREWITTNSSKEQIISNLAVKIAQKSIVFNELDKDLFGQFGTFLGQILKSGRMKFEAMAGCHDDRIMSLAIGLQAKIDYDVKVTKNFIDIVRI